ncbi:MAG: cell division protein FtsA [Deltaproteobacteria bacterium]|jgi:cell division protein FtsA|nr:cell division protein FtsA [Deltaproteobacteria bacterium]
MPAEKNVYAAVDVGTTKVCCVIGDMGDDDVAVNIKGLGVAPNRGLNCGRVTDIESTVRAIEKAVRTASDDSGVDVASVMVGIAGDHIVGKQLPGHALIKSEQVEDSDVEAAIDNALILNLGPNEEILTKVPLEYAIDERTGIMNPLGLRGTRLEVLLHVFKVSSTAYRDLINCVMQAGLGLSEVILESIASAEAVLEPSEKQQGVALLDLGGGSVDLAVFYRDAVHHVFEIAEGGQALSTDLATALNIPLDVAASLKEQHGCCWDDLLSDDVLIEVPTHDGSYVNVAPATICDCLKIRLKQILDMLSLNLASSGYDEIVQTIVLTGGTAQLSGLREMCTAHFNRPVRVGSPLHVTGLVNSVASPIFSTAVGLLLHGPREPQNHQPFWRNISSSSSYWGRLVNRLRGGSRG